jgi:leucyl-tRNA synthetase
VNLDEPFAGLFTQGMVCHETYRDARGAWHEPAEVEKRDGGAYLKSTGEKLVIGASEKMSKSKKNVVAPETIADAYGVDTIRWFMLSDTPPERDIEWTQEGAEGCWRFTQRVHRLVTEGKELPPPGTAIGAVEGDALALRRATHRAIHAVTEDIEALRFNRAVAQIYTLANAIGDAPDAPGPVRREALEALVLLSAPMMPHLAETCWQALGHARLVVETPWPKADPALIRADSVTIGVQVNGKLRGQVEVPTDASEDIVRERALALDGVRRAMEGRAPKRVIVVKGRVVNVVV